MKFYSSISETGLYVALVPGIPGAHTQAETLDELQKNLKEVVELCLEEMDPESKKQLPEFNYFFQNSGITRIRTVYISNRPNSMQKIKVILPKSGMKA